MNNLLIFDLSEAIAWIISAATRVISTLGYPGIGLAVFLENVIPSIPSEIILPFAGSLILEEKFTLVGITIAGTIGSLLGAWVYYGLGYKLEEARIRALIRNYGKFVLLSESDFDRIFHLFQRKGELVIFFSRMIPLVRSLISIPAGMTRMSPVRFSLFTVLGTALWSLLLAYIGKILGENWGLLGQWISEYRFIVIIILGAVIIWVVARRILRLRKKLL